MEEIFDALIERQRKVFLSMARRVIPSVTEEDLLQPNDFPALENHPAVRYEEGVLHGLQAAKAAFSCSFQKKGL